VFLEFPCLTAQGEFQFTAPSGLAEAFPESGLQIGLWLNGTSGCRDILDGSLDYRIHQLWDFIDNRLPKSTPKVFLRVGYEFDNPWFGYSDSPSTYQKAFQRLVLDCETQLSEIRCHEKMAFVWHSWAAPRVIESLDEFYPGDDYVDWIGISVFQQLYPWANERSHQNGENEGTSGNFAGGDLHHVVEVIKFAKSHEKPIMIAESAPFGGRHIASTDVARGFVNNTSVNERTGDILWDLWFQKTIDLIDEFDISMWSYINCDWDSQPMWHDIGFGDTRLSSSKLVMNNWWKQVANGNSRFRNRIDCIDGRTVKMEIVPVKASGNIFRNITDGNRISASHLLSTLSYIVLFTCVASALITYLNRKKRFQSILDDERLTPPTKLYGSFQ
jgi:hypothetical protein